MKGKLTFTGSIDLNQFWPQNVKTGNSFDSDADTVKVLVDVNSVIFTPAKGAAKKTKLLQTAGFFSNIKNKKTGKVTRKFKPVINAKGYVTMRLQGIDAPELHYMTGKPLYRQHWGNICTVELYNYLKKQTTGNSINCEVYTQVDKPNDVFDKYGRCVGDVQIKEKSGKIQNVNHWLIEKGYAFPAFYNSMTDAEINEIIQLTKSVQKKRSNIWSGFSQKMKKLDRTLTHSAKDGTYSRSADAKAPVIFPKLFRRLWTFEIQKKQIFTTSAYHTYMLTNKSDVCCDTKSFLKSGFPKKGTQLGTLVDSKGGVKFKPEDIVFKESPTVLKDKNEKPITNF